MEERKELVTGITCHQMIALSSIFQFYQHHLWNFTPPSVKRTRQVMEVHMLLIKLSLLTTSEVGMFTSSEVDSIKSAINVFVAQAKAKMPQSENRDAVIRSCEELCEHFVCCASRTLLQQGGHVFDGEKYTGA